MEECLRAIKENNVDEIVLVDGNSTDDTVAIARQFTDRIISDEGKGLGYARRIGAEAAHNDLVAMVSPDNILAPGCLEQLVKDMQEFGWVGVQALQRSILDEHSSYWDRGWDYMLEIVVATGPSRIIGNSSLYKKDALLKYPFDSSFKTGDDTDICERWRADGLYVGVGRSICYEKQPMQYDGFKARWKWYGSGDAYFIRKYRGTAIGRRHMWHPFKNYIIGKSARAIQDGRFSMIPYFILAGIFRYIGMFKTLAKLRHTSATAVAPSAPANESARRTDTDAFGRDI